MKWSIPLLFCFSVAVCGAASKDACSLIASADAEAALGEPVGAGQSEPRASAQGDGTACKFRSTQSKGLKAKTVSLTVHYVTSDIRGDMGAMADNLKSAGFQNVHPVQGVGDEAFWASRSMLGKLMGELTVRKGKSILMEILVVGVPDEATSLERAKAIALKAVPKA